MARLRREREELAAAKRAPNSVRAYGFAWADFEGWCREAGRRPLPASGEAVELYLVDRSKVYKPATLELRLAAIRARHEAAGHKSPVSEETRELLGAIKRRRKNSGPAGKAALTPEELFKASKALRWTARDVRDRAVLVLGFATGLRRSELAALELSDVRFVEQGLVVHVGRSKTDQEGDGVSLGIFPGRRARTCPVRMLRRWLKVRGTAPGPLFHPFTPRGERLDRSRGLGAGSILDIVKRCVALIGLDPAEYGAHSLRAGMVTAAIVDGVPEAVVMRRSRHRSRAVMGRYVRIADLFRVNPLARAL
ncbi:MAG TPA: site-specific integrase [Bryobacteraceae bacterium]|nr:site-specific integrase [Bryobacteraceae bacterium]